MRFLTLKCKNNKKELAYYIFSHKFAEKEPRAKSQEPRTKSQEQRTKNKEQRA
jgi:hypothetical protein